MLCGPRMKEKKKKTNTNNNTTMCVPLVVSVLLFGEHFKTHTRHASDNVAPDKRMQNAHKKDNPKPASSLLLFYLANAKNQM